jgi:FemAB-related protein (PEP-CTERM system-associated)
MLLTPNIETRFIQETESDAWDAYVQNHPNGTLFHLTAWKEVVALTFGHKSYYLVATGMDYGETGGPPQRATIIGVLPLFRIKSLLFGDFLISVPFAEIGGPLSDSKEVEGVLLEKAKALATELGCDYLELRNRTPIDGLATKDLYYNFRREIFPNLDENLTAIPRKARRMIRQGEKYGLTAEFGSHLLHEHYQLMAESYHHLGTPIFSKKLFEHFVSLFDDKVEILVIRDKDKIPIAAVMSFFYKDQVVPYWAGSKPEYRKFAPNDFMYWQLMKYGCENGYKVFDYGRSKMGTGSFNFKRHWGFEPTQLAYQYHLVNATEMPNLSPANPKYKRKIEMWRKLPLGATKIIGPRLAKYLA